MSGTQNAQTSATRVISPVAMLSYPRIAEPQEETDDDGKPTGKKKYSACLVFLPGTDLLPLKRAIAAAAEAKLPGEGTKKLQSRAWKNPLRDDIGDRGYPPGSVFINVRAGQQPGCVYPHAEPGSDKPAKVPKEKLAEVFYPGCFVKASLNAFYFERKGNKGISFGLNNIQFVKDGDRLDNRKAAEDEFDADLSATPADLASLGF